MLDSIVFIVLLTLSAENTYADKTNGRKLNLNKYNYYVNALKTNLITNNGITSIKYNNNDGCNKLKSIFFGTTTNTLSPLGLALPCACCDSSFRQYMTLKIQSILNDYNIDETLYEKCKNNLIGCNEDIDCSNQPISCTPPSSESQLTEMSGGWCHTKNTNGIYYLLDNQKCTLTYTIHVKENNALHLIGKNNIDGSSQSIITGNYKTRLFLVTDNGQLTMQNIIIENGMPSIMLNDKEDYPEYWNFSPLWKSSVYNDSSLISSLTHSGSGGCIYVNRGSLTLINATVRYCIATAQGNNSSSIGGGGGIFSSKSKIHLNNVNIIKNQAANGGGILAVKGSEITFEKGTKTNIFQNKLTELSATMTEKPTKIIKSNNGGGMYLINSNINISGTNTTLILRDNGGSYTYQSDGSACSLLMSHMYIFNGGHVIIDSNQNGYLGTLKLAYPNYYNVTTTSSNSLTSLHVEGVGSTLTITNNDACIGGGIATDGQDQHVHDGVDNDGESNNYVHFISINVYNGGKISMSNNTATCNKYLTKETGILGNGGAIHLYKSTLNVYDRTSIVYLYNNHADHYGGGIISISSIISIYNGGETIIDLNYAGMNGMFAVIFF
jgi:hypothetical protein